MSEAIRGTSSIIAPKLLIVHFKGEFLTLSCVEFPFTQTYLNTLCLQWLIAFWWLKKKGGGGSKSLWRTKRLPACLSLHQHKVQTFEAVGDAPAVVLTVDTCLWECMNIYQCKMGAISLTQYRLHWLLRYYLVLVALFALKQVQSPCVLLTHCHYWRTSHQLPVAEALGCFNYEADITNRYIV